MTTKNATLTIDDLYTAMDDDRHLGWGYATSRHLPAGYRARLDHSVITAANELGMTREELFHWTNAKPARWLVDAASSGKINHDLARKFVSKVEA